MYHDRPAAQSDDHVPELARNPDADLFLLELEPTLTRYAVELPVAVAAAAELVVEFAYGAPVEDEEAVVDTAAVEVSPIDVEAAAAAAATVELTAEVVAAEAYVELV